MKHARADYDRIQDPAGLIPEDEPVFLIRAQDSLAPNVVMAWAQQAREAGASEEIVIMAINHATRMVEWQAERGHKLPDLPPTREQS